ncbi:MAG TPA: precorrin-8X methylmutase, partial [Pseudonocardiaceae bacterium]|nr:precorrin-8X methylmutase [Pseudonocardiaceae bacterium]
MRRPHPIEVESYRILRSRVDTSGLPPLTRAVVERVVHTTADITWMGDIVADEAALCAGRAALLAGAPLVVDVRMVAAGITSRDAVVALDLADDELAIERTTRAGTGGLAGAELAIERTTRAGGGAGGRDAVGGGVARGSDMAAERSTRAVAGGRNAVSAAEGSTRAGVSGRVG